MMQRCDDERWKVVGKLMHADAPCGRAFDDMEQSTQCPHDRLGEAGLICRETDLYKALCPHCKRKEAPDGEPPAPGR